MSDWSNGVLAQSPKAYYRLSESSGLVANDSSGNGNNGALFGVSVYGRPGAIANDTDTSILFAPNGGLLLPNSLLPLLWKDFTIEFLTFLGEDWRYAALIRQNSIMTFYLDNVTVLANGGGNNYTNIFFSQDLLFGGNILQPGYLDEWAIYSYAFSHSLVANRWTLFQQARQAPIETVLCANAGSIAGVSGQFAHENVRVNLSTGQVLSRTPLPQ